MLCGASREPGEIPEGTVDAMMRLARQTGLAIEVADHAREMADVAVHEERRHLALTIHDSVGAILFSIGAATRDLETERECEPALRARLKYIEQQVAKASAQLRQALRSLNEVPQEVALGVALRAECRALEERTGMKAGCVVLGELPALEEGRAKVLLQAAREALHNAEKHARARSVVVSLHAADGGVSVVVADDGVGLGQPAGEATEQPVVRAGPRSHRRPPGPGGWPAGRSPPMRTEDARCGPGCHVEPRGGPRPPEARIRLLVVDDHPVVCEGVSLLVHSSTDIVVTGSARSAEEAVAVARQTRPDVVLLDLRLPDMLASEAVKLLRMAAPRAKIVIFTAYAGHKALKAAIEAGVDGCLLKDAADTDLVEAIRRVARGESVYDPRLERDSMPGRSPKMPGPRADPPGVRGPAPGGDRRDEPRDRRGDRPVPQHGEDLPAVGPAEAGGPQPGRGHRPGQRIRPAVRRRCATSTPPTPRSRSSPGSRTTSPASRMRETKYKIPRRSKDPFRHLLRDYVAMEEEKDNRQYGALEDVVARTRSPERAQHRWMEVLKPLLSMTTCAEYAAVKCMASLIDAVDNPELRQGYVAQMLDEIRHTNQETYLIRYLARHAPDPAGFNSALSARSVNPLIRAARGAVFDVFLNEDPLTCSMQVQVVGEAGYTNAVFVAATEIAAANDDPATPSVFLNIQSDEVRHMANGYATLSALLAEPDNLPTLQRDFDTAFWRLHVFMDNFLGVVYDYFPKVRLRSYQEYWEQWIWEDWIGGYVERLAPFGLEVPRWTERIRTDIAWGGHTCAMVAAALWPVHYWRHDVMGPDDFEYLEDKYPGWERYYGSFWRQYEEMSDPANGALALSLIESIPPLCRVCHMPAILPRPDLSDIRIVRDTAGPQARALLGAVRVVVPGGAVALPVRHLAGALRRHGPRPSTSSGSGCCAPTGGRWSASPISRPTRSTSGPSTTSAGWGSRSATRCGTSTPSTARRSIGVNDHLRPPRSPTGSTRPGS